MKSSDCIDICVRNTRQVGSEKADFPVESLIKRKKMRIARITSKTEREGGDIVDGSGLTHGAMEKPSWENVNREC